MVEVVVFELWSLMVEVEVEVVVEQRLVVVMVEVEVERLEVEHIVLVWVRGVLDKVAMVVVEFAQLVTNLEVEDEEVDEYEAMRLLMVVAEEMVVYEYALIYLEPTNVLLEVEVVEVV